MHVTPEENEAYRKFVSDLAMEMGVFDLKGIETVWHYTDGNGFLALSSPAGSMQLRCRR